MHNIFIFLLFLVTAPVAFAATSLSSLPPEIQEEISKLCLPIQYREGAAAYRNCVQNEVSNRADDPQTALSKLSFDDKYAIQQACAKAGATSTNAYGDCIGQQVTDLQQQPQLNLNDVSDDELYAAQQACFDAQSNLGAAAYRNCMINQTDALALVARVDLGNLSALNKNALQLRCSANADSAASYRQCLGTEYSSVTNREPTFLPLTVRPRTSNTTPVVIEAPISSIDAALPDDSTINNEESAITLESIASNNSTAVTAETSADVTTVPVLERTVEPAIAVAETTPAPTTELTTTTSLESAQLPTPDRTLVIDQSTETVTATATQEAAPEPRVISRPELVSEFQRNVESSTPIANADTASSITAEAATVEDTLSPANDIEANPTPATATATDSIANSVQTNSSGDIASAEAPTTTDTASSMSAFMQTASEKAQQAWQWLLNELSNLGSKGWLILAGVLALPAILLGMRGLFRSVREPGSEKRSALAERIEPGLQTRARNLDHSAQLDDLFNDDDFDLSLDNAAKRTDADIETPVSVSVNDTINANLDNNAATQFAVKPVQAAETSIEDEFASLDEQPTQLLEKPPFDNAETFNTWLPTFNEADQQHFCIEYLLYWMAYSDNRYTPELKKRLFTSNDLSDTDKIKRWVLMQDVNAFAQAVQHIRSHCSAQQMEQIIAFLMAMLVSENNVTPAQNTLLRFLSDAFSIGQDELQQRFEIAFGHALPAIPRVDRPDWWEKQNEQFGTLWEPQSLQALPEKKQLALRLGLMDDYNENDVIQAFRRAARRCHPDRFSELGEKELVMAEFQFSKFEESRDVLLGVSA